jgi:uncharacterized protein YfkK (UPF0435 family)
MDLQKATPENLAYVVNEIKSQLKLVNQGLILVEDFQLEDYDLLLEIYEMIRKKKGQLTMMEIEGILEELREIRASNQ